LQFESSWLFTGGSNASRKKKQESWKRDNILKKARGVKEKRKERESQD